ncbi:hypothetical protein CEE45_10965 [Candidatus Heimdallarchaeota archaeon B3_Heim]|nr:MAG: hypothetical protein CEE45_10965 [Candidatus Heimdallarchaeota archaeon B3_Heim]
MTVLRELKSIMEDPNLKNKEKKKRVDEHLLAEDYIKDWVDWRADASTSRDKDAVRMNCLNMLRRYLMFLVSNEDNLELTLTDLKDEALEDGIGTKAWRRIQQYYNWSLGREITSYEKTKKKTKTLRSAYQSAHVNIRGFYSKGVHVHFSARYKGPREATKSSSNVVETDRKLKLIIRDSEGNRVLDREKIEKFFDLLPKREQVIFGIILTAGGHDIKDVLHIRLGDVKNQERFLDNGKYFIFKGNRNKGGEPFICLVARWATELIIRYKNNNWIDEDSDNEFFFKPALYDKNSDGNGRDNTEDIPALSPKIVSYNFRKAAIKSGLVKEDRRRKQGEYNQLRPKRFRHVFETLIEYYEVKFNWPRNVAYCFMGHSQDEHQRYSETQLDELLDFYKQVEKYLTLDVVVIRSGEPEVLANIVSGEVQTLRGENQELKTRLGELETTVDELVSNVHRYEELITGTMRPEGQQSIREAFEEE